MMQKLRLCRHGDIKIMRSCENADFREIIHKNITKTFLGFKISYFIVKSVMESKHCVDFMDFIKQFYVGWHLLTGYPTWYLESGKT